MCLDHFALIEVCSVDILVACLRISTGFKGRNLEHLGPGPLCGKPLPLRSAKLLKRVAATTTAACTAERPEP